MKIYHDGTKIPTATPKGHSSKVWYGFKHPLEDGEYLIASNWFINDTAVVLNTPIAGLNVLDTDIINDYTKLKLDEGILGKIYLITNKFSTNMKTLDERSFYLKVVKL